MKKQRKPEPEKIEAPEISPAQLEKQIRALERQKVILQSRERFMPFVKYTQPDPEAHDDATKSTYQNAKHHDAIARVMEEVEKGNVRQLILCMPPRHGKSELTTRRFPAWYLGRNPRDQVAVATYSDTFAEDFGREVRSIINSAEYKHTFPDVKLMRGSAAADRLQTVQGGQVRFVGRGGALTGRGAHCFVGETVVHTTDGEKQIRHIEPGETVLSFDTAVGQFVWKNVKAVARREGARIYRVATRAGRVVEATGDHPIYVAGRWKEAAELTCGDNLLCAVRNADDASGLRRRETFGAQARGVLLLQQVLGRCREYSQAWRTSLLAMRAPRPSTSFKRYAGAGPGILFGRVFGAGAAGRVRAARGGTTPALRAVQRAVYAAQQQIAVLFTTVRFACARWPNAGREQPAMAGWGCGEPSKTACYAAFSRASAVGSAARRRALPAVREHEPLGSASYRREPAEQPSSEPGYRVQALPRAGSLFEREGDFVTAVEDTGRDAAVYDIQVEGTHCFFANGVLVHNCLIIDDLLKDDKEASSQAIRDQAWNWFTKVAMTRRMGRKLVIIIMTRWHSDDIIGRLTDPENPFYNAQEAAEWKIINLPALAEDDDPLGRAPGEPLWPDGPDKFDLDFLNSIQRLDPLGFACLYQQRPSAIDGTTFKREYVRRYDPERLPENLRIYAASDHAVSTKERRDYSCFLIAGVDQQANIYLLDCFWERVAGDKAVETMLDMAALRDPLVWWAENGHISKALGPFLHKRMQERNVWFRVEEVTPVSDKESRAQSIAARMALGYLWFPRDAPWADKAIEQLMAFPNGSHDDFVDALSLIGLGLRDLHAPGPSSAPRKTYKFGTFGWLKQYEAAARRNQQPGYRDGY